MRNGRLDILEDATSSTICRSDRSHAIIALYRNVLPVPPAPYTKASSSRISRLSIELAAPCLEGEDQGSPTRTYHFFKGSLQCAASNKYGHLNFQALRRLSSQSMVEGMPEIAQVNQLDPHPIMVSNKAKFWSGEKGPKCGLFPVALMLYAGFLFGAAESQIRPGSRLLASDSKAWVSANGTFAFGFTPMDSQDRLQLGIWYANIPGDRLVVWSSNRDSPVGKDAVVQFEAAGNLVLLATLKSSQPIWSSNTSDAGAKTVVLEDATGNLVMYDAQMRRVWESFSHPTDTLLPGQPLGVGVELASKKSSTGYYTLKMLQQPTSLSLGLSYNIPRSYASGSDSYSNYSYWEGPEISNVTGDVVAVLDDEGSFGIVYGDSSSGAVYVYKNNKDDRGLSYAANHSSSSTVFRRLVIETNGNLRLYRYDKKTSQWVSEWAAVSDPCDIAGACGNGICSLDRTKTDATCTCLPGTSKVSSEDTNDQCVENSSLTGKCSAHHENLTTKFKISTVQQTNYYFSKESIISNHTDLSNVSGCGDACLSECNCVASIYALNEEKPYCWVLRSLDFGGFQDPSSTLFVKVLSNGTDLGGLGKDSPSSEAGVSRDKVVVLPIVLSMGVLIALLCLLLYYNVHRKRYLKRAMESSLIFSGAPIHFSFRDLQIRTSNFSQLLGTGGFGSVYKGSLRDGTLIAVKKLDKVLPHGEKEFITEVNTIGSMHHMNLVRLCGYSSEGQHRLLVYEFMKNGSLDKWIFPSNHSFLDWPTRYKTAIGTAQGIAYFHEQCRNRIIHCDIKPENILLDENFCPKVSDFGLAKLMGREHSHVVTMVRGTRGYLAPEWISNRPITVKADVYSYGMLLLEIVGGRRNLDMSYDAHDFFFPGWAFKELTSGTALKVADKRLRGTVDGEEVVRALQVAFWCIQDDVTSRPSMGEVVKILEGSLDVDTPAMPQTVTELIEEGLEQVYRAMRREFSHYSSFTINTNPSSRATCSNSTMSPR
ncbi:hypothetical protein V2J09_022405 [Rumex salicifolius]